MAIINLTKETFKQQISEVDKPVIVDFWAPWCTYCRRIAPAFDKIASQQEDKLIFAKLDIDDAAEIAEEYGVDTIPTLIIFKNGEVLGSIVAPDSKAKIEAFIEDCDQNASAVRFNHIHQQQILCCNCFFIIEISKDFCINSVPLPAV